MTYLRRNLRSASQQFNAVLGGHEDEQLSSRAYRLARTSPRWSLVRDILNTLFFDTYHCEATYYADRARARQLPD